MSELHSVLQMPVLDDCICHRDGVISHVSKVYVDGSKGGFVVAMWPLAKLQT